MTDNPPSQIPSEMLTESKCNEFASFLSKKINNIRKRLAHSLSYAEVTQIRPQFQKEVTAVTKSYYHLKNIAIIISFVSSQDLKKLVHAFITSRVDYCNGLLTGLPKKGIRLDCY